MRATAVARQVDVVPTLFSRGGREFVREAAREVGQRFLSLEHPPPTLSGRDDAERANRSEKPPRVVPCTRRRSHRRHGGGYCRRQRE